MHTSGIHQWAACLLSSGFPLLTRKDFYTYPIVLLRSIKVEAHKSLLVRTLIDKLTDQVWQSVTFCQNLVFCQCVTIDAYKFKQRVGDCPLPLMIAFWGWSLLSCYNIKQTVYPTIHHVLWKFIGLKIKSSILLLLTNVSNVFQ